MFLSRTQTYSSPWSKMSFATRTSKAWSGMTSSLDTNGSLKLSNISNLPTYLKIKHSSSQSSQRTFLASSTVRWSTLLKTRMSFCHLSCTRRKNSRKDLTRLDLWDSKNSLMPSLSLTSNSMMASKRTVALRAASSQVDKSRELLSLEQSLESQKSYFWTKLPQLLTRILRSLFRKPLRK